MHIQVFVDGWKTWPDGIDQLSQFVGRRSISPLASLHIVANCKLVGEFL